MPDLHELCAAAVEAATGDEAVEAYAEESRHTEASALRGEIEGLTFAESRGVGVRLIAGGRLGYAYAADPTPDEVREAVRRARENAALAEPDEFNLLPSSAPRRAHPGAVPRGPGRHRHRPQGRARAGPGATGDLRRPARHEDRRGADRRRRLARRDRVDQRRAGRIRADRRLVRGGLPRRRGRRDADRVLVHDRPRHRRAGLGGDRRRGGAARGAHAGCREAADREGPDRARPVRRDVVPGRAGRGALGGGRPEAALVVRVDGRSAGGVRAVHAGGRRDHHDRARGLAVRRRGRADRADRAVHRAEP